MPSFAIPYMCHLFSSNPPYLLTTTTTIAVQSWTEGQGDDAGDDDGAYVVCFSLTIEVIRSTIFMDRVDHAEMTTDCKRRRM